MIILNYKPMTKSTIALLMAASIPLLSACSSTDEPSNTSGNTEARISGSATCYPSRANGSMWEADHIGVTVTSSPNSNMADLYKNVEYSTEVSGTEVAVFSAVSNRIFFQDASETVTFCAYGPYNQSPDSENRLIVNTENQQERSQQASIDFIYASGATASEANPNVEFAGENGFKHKMCKLELILTPADGFQGADIQKPKSLLGGLIHTGFFNTLSGEATATGDRVEDWAISNCAIYSLSESDPKLTTYSAILLPQQLDGPLTLKVEIDGQVYTNNSIKPALEAGHQYTYRISIKKTGLEISGCTVTDWEHNETVSGDAIM